jgi:cysteine-rich repeat protein
VCGNGIIEAGEQCDDANRAGMDGCDKCMVNCAHLGAGAVKSDDHHCYRGYDEATFERAVAACKERGAHLVTITSAAENTIVRQLVNSSKFIGAWEDLSPMVEGNGDYAWVTGEALSYTNWAQGEPDLDNYSCSGWGNQRCYEHCLIMNGQGTWEDHRCDQPDGYACEWEPAGTVK